MEEPYTRTLRTRCPFCTHLNATEIILSQNGREYGFLPKCKCDHCAKDYWVEFIGLAAPTEEVHNYNRQVAHLVTQQARVDLFEAEWLRAHNMLN